MNYCFDGLRAGFSLVERRDVLVVLFADQGWSRWGADYPSGHRCVLGLPRGRFDFGRLFRPDFRPIGT